MSDESDCLDAVVPFDDDNNNTYVFTVSESEEMCGVGAYVGSSIIIIIADEENRHLRNE